MDRDLKPLTARRQATRRRLLDAARSVFSRVGFQGASVEEICEEAGFTRGAFYSNFENKDELMFDLAADYANQFVRWLTQRDTVLWGNAAEAIDHLVEDLASEQGLLAEWHTVTSDFELYVMRNPDLRGRWITQQSALRLALARELDAMVKAHHCRLRVPTRTFVDAALALARARIGARLLGRAEPRPGTLGILAHLVLPNPA